MKACSSTDSPRPSASEMSISILGAGRLGAAIARAFNRAEIDIGLATSSGVDSTRTAAQRHRLDVHAVSLEEALEADTIFLALPFLKTAEVGLMRSDWTGKTIVDCTNAFLLPNREEVLRGRLSTDLVAGHFPGAEVVKAFNQVPAYVLGQMPSQELGRRVVFVASNSGAASARIAHLADELGFSPIEVGRVDEGGVLIQAQNALVLRNLIDAGTD